MEPLLVTLIFWGSYFVVPGVLALLWWRHVPRGGAALLLVFVVLFSWVRFVEPQLLITREQAIELGLSEPQTIVLIADLHLGVFKGERFLARVVRRINEVDPDLVLIAGDLTFHPRRSALPRLMAPLGELEAPTYTVWGNHETQDRFADVRTPLAEILPELGVTLLNNEVVKLPAFTLVGLGTQRSGEDEVALLTGRATTTPHIILTHNPDTT
ncbi:hypothetical protein GVX82_02105, partial [Patescibacteria group bacterium]|nr:hypothetical protein [Patescibacteria group bacterium]